MRLWSIHPKYLDRQGLIALWREALLAKKVLEGKTTGYTRHPQLERFKGFEKPVDAINTYLKQVFIEAERRNYLFDKEKVGQKRTTKNIIITEGQLKYEFAHLKRKLKTRDPARYKELVKVKNVESHPLFLTKPGPVADWEKQ